MALEPALFAQVVDLGEVLGFDAAGITCEACQVQVVEDYEMVGCELEVWCELTFPLVSLFQVFGGGDAPWRIR